MHGNQAKSVFSSQRKKEILLVCKSYLFFICFVFDSTFFDVLKFSIFLSPVSFMTYLTFKFYFLLEHSNIFRGHTGRVPRFDGVDFSKIFTVCGESAEGDRHGGGQSTTRAG
jgi:hypothetical protein